MPIALNKVKISVLSIRLIMMEFRLIINAQIFNPPYSNSLFRAKLDTNIILAVC